MNWPFRYLLITFTASVLTGCNAFYTVYDSINDGIGSLYRESSIRVYKSGSYPNTINNYENKDQLTLILGPYFPRDRGIGGQFYEYQYNYNGPIQGKEIMAMWRENTSNKVLRYYARSKPEQGLQFPERRKHNFYSIAISTGPMLLGYTALSDEQKKTAEVGHFNDYLGKPINYRWDEWDKLYYLTGFFSQDDLENKHYSFTEIQAIELTKEQYNILYDRCHGEWRSVKCFMDENMPNLSNKQLAYIKSTKHPNDDARLAGEFPKPKDRFYFISGRYNGR
jgi:hypothetical protein